MRVGFIGAGKVGQSFAWYLKHQGVDISGFYSRRMESSSAIASALNCKAFETIGALVEQSDMVGITVNDDQINVVVDSLINLGLDLKTKFFFHMSGVHNSESLKLLSERVFTLHPLKAFPKIETSSAHFQNIYFSLENADAFILKWTTDIGLKTFEIQSDKKVKYHAAAAILSNYMVSIIDFGLHQLDDVGLERRFALEAMWPLIEDTLTNIKKLGPKQALTGPIARGDIETIKMHLSCLDAESRELYKSLGKYTLTLVDLDVSTNLAIQSLFEEEWK